VPQPQPKLPKSGGSLRGDIPAGMPHDCTGVLWSIESRSRAGANAILHSIRHRSEANSNFAPKAFVHSHISTWVMGMIGVTEVSVIFPLDLVLASERASLINSALLIGCLRFAAPRLFALDAFGQHPFYQEVNRRRVALTGLRPGQHVVDVGVRCRDIVCGDRVQALRLQLVPVRSPTGPFDSAAKPTFRRG
jgi:hypothetical protein